GDDHTYSLVSGSGSTDNASFDISGNQLMASVVFDFESKDSYSIRIRTNDGQATFDKIFTININDVAEETSPPSIHYYFPEHEEEVDIDLFGNDLAFDFEEAVTAGVGTVIQIKDYLTDAVVESWDIENEAFENGYVELAISPLEYGTKYYVIIASGEIVSDISGLAFSGLIGKDDWTFTTVAAPVAPNLSTLTPANGATDVPVSTSIILDFDVDVYVSPDVTLEVRNYATDDLIESFPIIEAAYVEEDIILTPANDLPNGTQLYVVLGGSGFIEGYDCNCTEFEGLTSKDEWSFTTVEGPDTESPIIVSFSPANNSADVALDADLVVTFNEEIVAGETFVRVRSLAGNVILGDRPEFAQDLFTVQGSSMTIHLDQAPNKLSHNTQYYVTIDEGGVVDLSGNRFEGISDNATWTFSTLENSPPVVTQLSPGDDAVDVIANSNLVMKFDRTIHLNETTTNGVFYIRQAGTNAVVEEINFTSGNVFVQNDTELVISGLSNLLPERSYWVMGFSNDGILLTDNDSNFFGNFNDPTFWNFTTIKIPQSIIFSTLGERTYGDEPFDLSASATSELPVSFTVESGPATILGNTLTITGAGSIIISASQSGDDKYAAANPVQQNFEVAMASLTVSADNHSIVYGEVIPELTMTYEGFVNDESASSLDAEPEVNVDLGGQAAPNAGVYDLIVSGG
ncbi:MAG: Ig-like domain-containing protein, partial [Ekhidna sp.]